MAFAPVTPQPTRNRSVGTAVPGAVLPVAITGLAGHLPEQIVTNDDWAARVETTDEWIRSRTGIVQRHAAASTDATSDLATEAGAAALEQADVDVADLAALIVATTTPDHVIPGTAPLVGAKLGTNAPAFDLNAACSGFVYGLRVAAGLASDGPVLLIGAETLSRVTDPTDRSTAVLFGDGAGAVVLEPSSDGTIGPFDLGADGTLVDLLNIPAGGTRRPTDAAALADRDTFLKMRGGEVYRHAVAHMTESSQAVLDAAGLSAADIDLCVGHQANQRILDAVTQRLGVPTARSYVTVDRHGNTSAASIPLALADAHAAGRLRPGSRILLTAFGAGLTWGSCLVTWPSEAA